MSQLFTSSGQSTGAPVSASVLQMNIPMNIQEMSIPFRIHWFVLLAVRGTLQSPESSPAPRFESINYSL